MQVVFKLQRHCTENSKQIYLEMKLRGLVPKSYIHVHVSDIGGPILRIYKSLTVTGMWKVRPRPRSFISGNT